MKNGDSETWSKVLRDAGLRTTQSRLAVLEVLENAKSPLSHADVGEQLAGDDRVTVYRNLVALAEAGIVRRTDLGDRIWRFELIREASSPDRHDRSHPHFVCTDCGSVACMPGVSVKIDGAGSVSRGGFDVQLRGICKNCDAPAPAKKRAT